MSKQVDVWRGLAKVLLASTAVRLEQQARALAWGDWATLAVTPWHGERPHGGPRSPTVPGSSEGRRARRALRAFASGLAFASVLGCHAKAPAELSAASLPAPRSALTEQPRSVGALVVVHGGQGSPAALSDGPETAVRAALAVLAREGPDAGLDAAQAAIEPLEDDPRFNAGTGAVIRADGRTIECDAAIAVDDGRFGAISGLSGIRHPIVVARAVMRTPHRFIGGTGARAFADRIGAEPAELRTQRTVGRVRAMRQGMVEGKVWSDFDWRAHWNFEAPWPDVDAGAAFAVDEQGLLPGEGAGERDSVGADLGSTVGGAFGATRGSEGGTSSAGGRPDAPQGGAAPPWVGEGDSAALARDTVGVVLRTSAGQYVAALSTGGAGIALRGRVGDVPQFGAGLIAGPHGAVAATGLGEAIVRERVAGRVYDLMAAGIEPAVAIRQAMRGITAKEGVGVIAISELGYFALASSQMAWAAGGPAIGGTIVRADQAVGQ